MLLQWTLLQLASLGLDDKGLPQNGTAPSINLAPLLEATAIKPPPSLAQILMPPGASAAAPAGAPPAPPPAPPAAPAPCPDQTPAPPPPPPPPPPPAPTTPPAATTVPDTTEAPEVVTETPTTTTQPTTTMTETEAPEPTTPTQPPPTTASPTSAPDLDGDLTEAATTPAFYTTPAPDTATEELTSTTEDVVAPVTETTTLSSPVPAEADGSGTEPSQTTPETDSETSSTVTTSITSDGDSDVSTEPQSDTSTPPTPLTTPQPVMTTTVGQLPPSPTEVTTASSPDAEASGNHYIVVPASAASLDAQTSQGDRHEIPEADNLADVAVTADTSVANAAQTSEGAEIPEDKSADVEAASGPNVPGDVLESQTPTSADVPSADLGQGTADKNVADGGQETTENVVAESSVSPTEGLTAKATDAGVLTPTELPDVTVSITKATTEVQSAASPPESSQQVPAPGTVPGPASGVVATPPQVPTGDVIAQLIQQGKLPSQYGSGPTYPNVPGVTSGQVVTPSHVLPGGYPQGLPVYRPVGPHPGSGLINPSIQLPPGTDLEQVLTPIISALLMQTLKGNPQHQQRLGRSADFFEPEDGTRSVVEQMGTTFSKGLPDPVPRSRRSLEDLAQKYQMAMVAINKFVGFSPKTQDFIVRQGIRFNANEISKKVRSFGPQVNDWIYTGMLKICPERCASKAGDGAEYVVNQLADKVKNYIATLPHELN